MKLGSKIKMVSATFVLVGLSALTTKSLLAGPSTAPRAGDVKKAQRTEGPGGADDPRLPAPPAFVAAGNGIVEPADRETKVAAQVAGRIAKVLVREGDHVDAGAALVELESAVEMAAFRAAEADVQATKADLAKALHGQRREDIDAMISDADAARAKADLAATTLERTKKLADGGAATVDELDRATQDAASAKRTADAADARRKVATLGSRSEDIAAARAKVDAAIARAEQAKQTLERLTIRAPIASEILQAKVRAGEYETPGGDALIVLGDTRKLRVRMDVDERDIARVTIGRAARVVADAFPGRGFDGTVVEIGRRMGRKNVRTDDPVERIDTKILEVVIDLDAPTGLVPGLRVTSYVE